eukprot:6420463-Amphidinium_carterae.2
MENEPKKYCHKNNENKPSTNFRTMVRRVQNSHLHTVKYLQCVGQQKRKMLRVDAALLRIMVSDFGGSADFVTSMGPGDSFVMLYSSPSCQTAPLRMRDWLYGRPSAGSSKTQYHRPCCAARWKWGTGRQEQ